MKLTTMTQVTVKSLWPRLAALPLVVESCEYDRLHAVLAHEFQRVTTHVRLIGAGTDGLGEDVSVHVEDGTSLHETQPTLPLEGEWTLAGFCEHLGTLDPWPKPPEWKAARRFRNRAFESASLDLALRKAGRALHEVLGLEPQPVRFVNSLGLGKQPSIEHLRRRLARSPGVRFKPYTPVTQTVRGLLTGTHTGGHAIAAIAWSLGIAIVSYLWAVRFYDRRRAVDPT